MSKDLQKLDKSVDSMSLILDKISQNFDTLQEIFISSSTDYSYSRLYKDENTGIYTYVEKRTLDTDKVIMSSLLEKEGDVQQYNKCTVKYFNPDGTVENSSVFNIEYTEQGELNKSTGLDFILLMHGILKYEIIKKCMADLQIYKDANDAIIASIQQEQLSLASSIKSLDQSCSDALRDEVTGVYESINKKQDKLIVSKGTPSTVEEGKIYLIY